ncbi:MAG: methyltransferase, TrmH family [Pseudonocardiales bacterium]|nr:methyltransferase, TrmH family [Pseudonocardiales bacterium]
MLEVFATDDAASRHADVLENAEPGLVALISDRAAASLSETVHPQGLIAVCATLDVSLAVALAKRPRLVAILVEANDPGNAGAILRTADAAGADAVLFTGDSVDPYNGKAVRATAGSLFHLDVVTGLDPAAAIGMCRAAGLLTLATTGAATLDLDELTDQGALSGRTAWVFGNEARGLPAELVRAAERSVRVPVHGRAESLNLAAAAAVCLYASARANRLRPAS